MSISLVEIARMVDGRLTGDETVEISGAATIRDAQSGDVTLADRPQLADKLAESPAAAVIVSGDFQPPTLPFITVENIHVAFAKVVARALRYLKIYRRLTEEP